MRIQEISWTVFQESARQIIWGIIPIGAVEAYGPHLPLGTDGIVAERLATILGEKLPAFVCPLIPVGYSSSFSQFPGTLSVSPAVLEEYVYEIGKSLAVHGVKKLLFLNGHAGNVQPINYAMERLEQNHGVFCVQIDVWRFLKPVSRDVVSDVEQAAGHASELMTSVMLHFYPHLVHLNRAPQTISPVQKRREGVFTVKKQSPEDSSAVSGNPLPATPEKGAQIIKLAIEQILATLSSF
ncbi:MAG: creatininase family protein [Candidatus Bathyarchaeia archaeon]